MSEVLKHQEQIKAKVEAPKNTTEQVENRVKKIAKYEVGKKTGEQIKEQTGAKEAGDKLKKILHLKEGVKEGAEKVSENFHNLETIDLLKKDVTERLNTITKGDKFDRKDLKEGKEIEFNFSKDGKKNEKLYLNTSAGQVLPVEVGTVTVNGIEYKRHGYEGEFFNEKGERLLIDDGTKITLGKPRTGEEIKEIAGKIKEDYDKLLKEQGIDAKKLKEGDKDKIDIIREGLKKGLDKNEINLIIEGKYQDINKIEPISKRKEVMKVLMHLEDSGYLINLEGSKEGLSEFKNSIKGDISENTPGFHRNKNGSVMQDKLNTDGKINKSSFAGRTYKHNFDFRNNINLEGIDVGYKNLQLVKNPEGSKQDLISRGISEHNAEIIAKRIPKEWFDVAIDFARKEGTIDKNKPIALASVSKKTGMISYPDGKFEQFPIITAKAGRTNMIGEISHFDGGKISGKGKDASKSGSKTVLGAAAYSPEGGANGGKWWHGVADYRIPNGKTWGCVGIKQEIAMRLVRSIQKNGGGYGYEVS